MKKYAGYEVVNTGAGRNIYVREGESYSLFRGVLRECQARFLVDLQDSIQLYA